MPVWIAWSVSYMVYGFHSYICGELKSYGLIVVIFRHREMLVLIYKFMFYDLKFVSSISKLVMVSTICTLSGKRRFRIWVACLLCISNQRKEIQAADKGFLCDFCNRIAFELADDELGFINSFSNNNKSYRRKCSHPTHYFFLQCQVTTMWT